MSYQFKPKPQKKVELPLSPRLLKVQKFCEENGWEFQRRGEDYNEIEFYDVVRRNPKSLVKRITGIYRLLLPNKALSETGEFDQALIYHMQQEAIRPENGTYIQDDRMQGVYQVPITDPNLEQRLTVNPNQRATNKGTRPVYEIEFTPENVDKIVKQSSIGVSMFYLAHGTSVGPNTTSPNPDTIKNIDDFKNGEFYELIDMSKYNFTTSEPKLAQWRKEGKEVKSNAHLLNTLNASNAMNQRRG